MKLKVVAKNNRGMTLLEVILAVFILAVVVMPLMNMFVESTRFTVISEDVTNTTYSAQAKIEELYKKTYAGLFTGNPDHAAYNGKFYSIKTAPTGALDKAMFSGAQPCYAHLIINGGSMVFTGPDGQYATGSTGNVALTVTGSGYTVSGSISCSGAVPAGKPLALIINAGALDLTNSVAVNLYGAGACALYEKPEMSFLGKVSVYGVDPSKFVMYDSDVPPRTMLVEATCLMYKTATAAVPQAVVQDSIEVAVR